MTEAIDLVNKAMIGTKQDQKLYSILAFIGLLGFMATFTQLLSTR